MNRRIMTPEEAVRNKARAREDVSAHPDAAIKACSEVLAYYPADVEAYTIRASAKIVISKFHAAREDLNTALGFAPDYADALAERGTLNWRMERDIDALDDINASIQSEPAGESYVIRGLIYINLGEHGNALNDFNSALQSDELGADYKYYLYSRRGKIYMNKGKTVEAFRDFTFALKYAADDIEIRKLRSLTASEIGAHRISLYDINKVLVCEPTSENYLLRAVSKEALRFGYGTDAETDRETASRLQNGYIHDLLEKMVNMEYDEAVTASDQAIESAPTSELYYIRGLLKEVSNRRLEAMDDFNTAIEMDPHNLAAITKRAKIHAEFNNFDGETADKHSESRLRLSLAKIATLEGMRNLHSKNPEAPTLSLAYFGIAAEMAGDIPNDKVAIEFRRVLDTDTNKLEPELRQLLDLFFTSKKENYDLYDQLADKVVSNTTDSINNTESMVNLIGLEVDIEDLTLSINTSNTPHVEDYYQRGYAYLQTGRYEEAISDLNRVISLTPKSTDHAPAYHALGVIDMEKGDSTSALAKLTLATLLNPNFTEARVIRAMIHKAKNQTEKSITDCLDLCTDKSSLANAFAHALQSDLSKRRYEENKEKEDVRMSFVLLLNRIIDVRISFIVLLKHVIDEKKRLKEFDTAEIPKPIIGQDSGEIALIPAGEFQMGSNGGREHERAVPTVYVDAFYMDKYEVTNAQFKAFVDANPQWRKDLIAGKLHNGLYLRHWDGNTYPSGKADHPVVYVPWYAAMAYAEWADKRLPTEAEWEYAARGGLKRRIYPNGNRITRRGANFNANVGNTTPVGKYPANGYGLYDMAGNVWEWCIDEYDRGFYKESPARNPISGGSVDFIKNNYINNNSYRVLRGGSWSDYASYVRVAYRGFNTPSVTGNCLGFRCARVVQ